MANWPHSLSGHMPLATLVLKYPDPLDILSDGTVLMPTARTGGGVHLCDPTIEDQDLELSEGVHTFFSKTRFT